jgi:hypothetical protein
MNDTKRKIMTAAAYGGKTQADIARACGFNVQAFSNKLALEQPRFSLEEWQKIAEAVGARYDSAFEFPDGMRI